MRAKIHYQPPITDFTGEGNHEPLACGRDDVQKVNNSWRAVTCKSCLRKKPTFDGWTGAVMP